MKNIMLLAVMFMIGLISVGAAFVLPVPTWTEWTLLAFGSAFNILTVIAFMLTIGIEQVERK
ncbi:hypothetical protein ACFFGV_06530 [Pontibacillus salicampi]|uniref:Uncharacterized protein n=1 Tax=Pontibacillus salicampi TaxID=1449801 RepID=A0ABV6LLF8_9BACI